MFSLKLFSFSKWKQDNPNWIILSSPFLYVRRIFKTQGDQNDDSIFYFRHHELCVSKMLNLAVTAILLVHEHPSLPTTFISSLNGSIRLPFFSLLTSNFSFSKTAYCLLNLASSTLYGRIFYTTEKHRELLDFKSLLRSSLSQNARFIYNHIASLRLQ